MALVAGAQFDSPIRGASTWVTAPSRRLKLWGRIDSSQQPTAFLVQHREGYIGRTGLPPRRYLDLGIWAYAPSGEDSDVGDEYLDIMETAIEGALVRDSSALGEWPVQFGQTVYYARIDRTEGLLIRDPGDIDGQALLVLPVRVLLP